MIYILHSKPQFYYRTPVCAKPTKFGWLQVKQQLYQYITESLTNSITQILGVEHYTWSYSTQNGAAKNDKILCKLYNM